MEYLFFYGLFAYWLVGMLLSVPRLPSNGGEKKGELKDGRFGVAASGHGMRKAA